MSLERKGQAVQPQLRGGDLFIVDNSVSGWTGIRYLHDWCEIARSFDIATGFFEIGALLELDGKWQGLEKIRILMGAEVTHATKAAFIKATKERAEVALDQSIEDEKSASPFLHGVPAIVEALKSGQIECRVYTKDKFHAKAYITHAKLDVVGSQALVGSSNFTRPGLTQNVELNIQVQSGREVAQLQQWFEEYWKQAQDVTPDVLSVVERHMREYTPFDVYAKALQEFFRGHEITAGEWDVTKSLMFPQLDRYQQEAYWALMKIARQHGGAFLCDGVGLGKTFVGLMLIERLSCTRASESPCSLRRRPRRRCGSHTSASGSSAASVGAPTSATSRSSATPTWAVEATSPSVSGGSPSSRTRWSSTRRTTSGIRVASEIRTRARRSRVTESSSACSIPAFVRRRSFS